MLELMHFADELIDLDEFKLPAAKAAGKKELQMAAALIDSMSGEWKPEEYVDEYRDALEKVIEEKVEKGGKLPKKTVHRVKPTNVIDLVSVLQKSLNQNGSKSTKKKPAARRSKATSKPRRKAA
jgi:DNA end-binding protein Ku